MLWMRFLKVAWDATATGDLQDSDMWRRQGGGGWEEQWVCVKGG